MEPPFIGGAMVRAHVSWATARVGMSNRAQVPRTARDAGLALASRVRLNIIESTIVGYSMNGSLGGDIRRTGSAGLTDRFVLA